MSIKMLFIRPPAWEMSDKAKNQNIIYGTTPYGVLSIMSYINKYKTQDIEVDILDLNVAPWTSFNKNEIAEQLKIYLINNHFDIIGLSIMYNHMYQYIQFISKIIKEDTEDSLVIVGGACATVYYDKILSECDVDAVCYAEGELPIFDLLESNDFFYILKNHQSFITYDSLINGKIPIPTFIENLDDIPPVDFSLVDLNLYSNKFSIMRPVEIKDEFCLPITTTRGCPFDCVFCTAKVLSGKKVRKMSVERVISDIKEMKEKYNINSISIEDDQALFDKKRAKLLLEKLSELNLNLFVAAGFTLSLIDDAVIKLMKKAGLQMITLPIESGSSYIAYDVIHKPIKLNDVPLIVEKLRKNDIYCHGNIIIGFPSEKEIHRQESIDFIKNSGVDWCYLFCATPLKGSRLYDICIDNNYIDPDEISSDGYTTSHINTPDFTSEEITEKAYLMNLELNFVCNNNMKRKEYSTALKYFKHIVLKYTDHAFAHYYISKCYDSLGDIQKSNTHFEIFNSIIHSSELWLSYSKKFGLI